jgi:hypothetical protein
MREAGEGHEGRIAVVVTASLSEQVGAALDTFTNDLVAEGHRVALIWVTDPLPTDLRNLFRDLYDDATWSLSGVVLVGGSLPWVLYSIEAGYINPADGFYMDLGQPLSEGQWAETWSDNDSDGVYDHWQGPAEIWASRIKCDNLGPEITLPEADVINAYFARNHAARTSTTTELFGPAYNALVYQGAGIVPDFPYWQGDAAALANAFSSVTPVYEDWLACRDDYLSRIRDAAEKSCLDPEAEPVPLPGPYYFVQAVSHGSPVTHYFDSLEGVRAADYVGQNVNVVGYIIDACFTSDFSRIPEDPPPPDHPEYAWGNLGPAIVFDPDASTLLLIGHAYKFFFTSRYAGLWSRVGAGECFGEGYKAFFNVQSSGPTIVLLGDGSLKAKTFDWTGAFSQAWHDERNWQPGVLPTATDRVRIDGASVLADVGSPEQRAYVWSVALHGGANLELQGGEQAAGLELAGSLMARSHSTPSTMMLGARSRLDLPGPAARVTNVDIVMADGETGTTQLNVSGTIEGVAHLSVGPNCHVTADQIDSAHVLGPISGQIDADQISYSDLVLAAQAVLNVTDITHSSMDATVGTVGSAEQPVKLGSCTPVIIGAAAIVTLREVSGCDVEVHSATIYGAPSVSMSTIELHDGAILSAGGIQTSTVTVSEESVVAASQAIRECSFSVAPGGLVHANAGITDSQDPLDPEPSKWDIDHGAVTVAGDAFLRRNWELAGTLPPPTTQPSASFFRMRAENANGIEFELANGAQVQIACLPEPTDPAQAYPFPGGSAGSPPRHRLLYGGTDNRLSSGGGTACGANQAMYFGNGTCILPSSGDLSELELDLSCGLVIATHFGTAQGWNTTNVDVTFERISEDAGAQKLELISAILPAVFTDVECNAAFRALYLPAASSGADVLAVDDIVNRDGTTQENGIFTDIKIEAGRRLVFPDAVFGQPHSVIYYTGGLIWDSQHAEVWVGDPPAGTKLTPRTIGDALVHRGLTIYGDWSPAADCVITNVEVAQLQAAILGGPSHYVAYMDADCDGVLTAQVEMAKLLANYAIQPPPDCAGADSLLGGGGMEESSMSGDDLVDGEPVDVPALAAWLVEQFSPEDVAAFVAQASATAAEHADDAVGADIMELLTYLQ